MRRRSRSPADQMRREAVSRQAVLLLLGTDWRGPFQRGQAQRTGQGRARPAAAARGEALAPPRRS